MSQGGLDRKMREKALKDLIDKTISEAGDIDADELPHRIRERLKGLASSDLDVDSYIRQATRARRKP